LRKEVARAEVEAAAEESAEESERADLFDTTNLQDSVTACAQLYYSLEFTRKENEMTKKELAKSKVSQYCESYCIMHSINTTISLADVHRYTLPCMQFFVEARQLKLLSELQSIYPIVLLENGDYTIRGVELPADIYSPTM
jgi:hypothetical protein